MDTSWITAMRAETLAKLVLSRRPDLQVLAPSGGGTRAEFDLLVRIGGADTSVAPEFGVEAKGIDQPLSAPSWRGKLLRALRQGENGTGQRQLPLCLFVFDIDGEDGVYLWLNEPVVDADGRPVLRPAAILRQPNGNRSATASGDTPFQRLDSDAIDRVVKQVVRWHQERDRLVQLALARGANGDVKPGDEADDAALQGQLNSRQPDATLSASR